VFFKEIEVDRGRPRAPSKGIQKGVKKRVKKRGVFGGPKMVLKRVWPGIEVDRGYSRQIH